MRKDVQDLSFILKDGKKCCYIHYIGSANTEKSSKNKENLVKTKRLAH